jgi:hypothetical protein
MRPLITASSVASPPLLQRGQADPIVVDDPPSTPRLIVVAVTPWALAPLLAGVLLGVDPGVVPDVVPGVDPASPSVPTDPVGENPPVPELPSVRGVKPPSVDPEASVVEVSPLAEPDWPAAVRDPFTPVVPPEPATPSAALAVEPVEAWFGMKSAAARIPATNAAMTVAGVRPLRRARLAHWSIPPVLVELGSANRASSQLTEERHLDDRGVTEGITPQSSKPNERPVGVLRIVCRGERMCCSERAMAVTRGSAIWRDSLRLRRE